MFAQVIRCRLKPASWGAVEELDKGWEKEQAPTAPGFKGAYWLRDTKSPDDYIVVVLFESQELAQQNSDRPETNEWYQKFKKLMAGEPEFINTDVARSYLT